MSKKEENECYLPPCVETVELLSYQTSVLASLSSDIDASFGAVGDEEEDFV